VIATAVQEELNTAVKATSDEAATSDKTQVRCDEFISFQASNFYYYSILVPVKFSCSLNY
jgi:hypothetical protein